MSTGLIKSSNTCTKLYRKCISKSKTDQTYKTYITYINLYNQPSRLIIQNNSSIINMTCDMRQTWTIINNTTVEKFVMKLSKTIMANNNIISDPNIITNKLCDYFTNMGLKYANNIPTSNIKSHFYLSKRNKKDNNSIFRLPTDANEINKIIKIKTLKNKNSAGHDELSTTFLKSLGQSITYLINLIINKSIQQISYQTQ